MKKVFTLLVLMLFLVQLNVQAQTVLKLHIEMAGTLPSLIAETEKNQIVDLTLTGNLNGTDFRYIREMAGEDIWGSTTEGRLTVLNLEGANIVEGGEDYFSNYAIGSYSTLDNIIGQCMFYELSNLTTVILPKNITSIGVASFSGCAKLNSIKFPNSVTSIKYWAFSGCSSLTNVTIGNNVESIDHESFASCENLISITIPSSVKSIDEAFNYCSELKEIIVSEENTKYSTIDGVLFNKDKTILIAYPNAKSNVYTIPNNVTSIGDRAFTVCSGLTSVTMPNSVTSIGEEAFNYCRSLKEIHCLSSTPAAIGKRVFYDIDINSCILYVPKGSYDAYRQSEGWRYFTNIIEEDLSSISENEENAVKVYTEAGLIIVQNVEIGETIAVYSESGILIKRIKATDDINRIELSDKGIYIVRIANQSVKVILH